MSDVSRSLIYQGAHHFDATMSGALARIENIKNDKNLQDYLFLRFLLSFGKGELLRLEMADMCGTYTLGNYVSNFIEKKYSNDKRYLLQIRQRKKEIPKYIPNNQVVPDEKIEEIQEGHDISIKPTNNIVIDAGFPGGDAGFRNYLRNELSKISNPPDIKLIVRFKIMQDGLVDSVSIENTTNTEIEQKVILVFKNSPKWIPAQLKDGVKTTAYRKQPIILGNADDK